MVLLAAIGGGAFLLVSQVGGVRLLLLAWRTRGLPETVLGASLLLMGGVATPLAILSKAPLGLPYLARLIALIAHHGILALGMTGIAIFTWRVFRPDRTWAKLLTAGVAVSLTLCLASLAFGRGYHAALRDESLAMHAFSMASLVPLLWASLESLRYGRTLRKRVAFGLADPVVANRIWLWGVAIGIAAGLAGIAAFDVLLGVDLVATPTGAGLIGPVALVAASSLYLAFLPPRRYTAWIAQRAAARS